MTKIKSYALIAPMVAWLALMFFVGFSEYWLISVEADPEVIKSYYFGSESMISHGGAKYSSSGAYSKACLLMALLAFVGATLSMVTLSFSKNYKVLKSYAVGVVTSLLLFIVF